MCKLSVIIPAYDAEKFVIRCLDSVLASININDYEIIIIDDGSTDKTIEILNTYVYNHNDTCIRIIHQENSGQGVARNKGLTLANGKYVMFLDIDDSINPIDFDYYYHVAESKNLDLLRFAFKVYDAEGHFSISQMLQFNDNKVYSGQEAVLMDYTIGSACGTLFRRDFLIKFGFNFRDDMAHEDCEFMLRLLPKVNQMMVSSACLYTYCWNANSTDRAKSVRNIVRLKQSDILVAESYFVTADKESLDSPIKKYYHRKGNSLLTQFLLSLICQTKQLSLNEKKRLLSFASSQGVYPTISLRTLSWKTTLLLFFLNRPMIEKSLLRLFNRKRN